jgi:CheY-like chemotaxis protein
MTLPPLRLRRILVADDDREVRLGVAELLAALGLEVLHAESGIEAVELVRGTRIHAALLDMHMPGCTGAQALPLLRGLDAHLPCIVYSGRWSRDLEQEVLSLGAFACLKKPVEPVMLRRTVQVALHLPLDLAGDLGGDLVDDRGDGQHHNN